jgi:hypothetical protein
LQPVEVAKFLEKEMVANRKVVGNRVYAPNWFRAELSMVEFRQFEPILQQLEREIASDLNRQASSHHYILLGAITVELLASATLRKGDVLATAELRDTPLAAASTGLLEQAVPASDLAPALAPTPGQTVVMPANAGVAAAPAATAPTTTTPPLLIFRDEQGVEQRIRMPAGHLTVGRSLENDIVLDGLSVSREHARLTYATELVIEDLASRNGTFVNNQRITSQAVKPGDRVRLGAAHLTIEP